jgi:hypothetical protein
MLVVLDRLYLRRSRLVNLKIDHGNEKINQIRYFKRMNFIVIKFIYNFVDLFKFKKYCIN